MCSSYQYQSCSDIDSDVEERLYAQLHHEENPLFAINDTKDSDPITQICRIGNDVKFHSTPKERHAKDVIDNADSKYHFKKSSVVSLEVTLPVIEDVIVIEDSDDRKTTPHRKNKRKLDVSDFLDPSATKSTKSKEKRAWSKKKKKVEESICNVDPVVVLSDSSDEITFKEELQTNVSINVSGDKRFCDVNEILDYSSFSVATLQNSMTNKDWDISFEDRYSHIKERKRYFGNKINVKCHNCGERGHLSKVCRRPKKHITCYLCGETGHVGSQCFRVVCSICSAEGHLHENCRSRLNPLKMKCTHCHYRGHDSHDCPDLWRRYHLTTKVGPVIENNPMWNGNVQCYNCAGKNHYGYECKLRRMNWHAIPTYPGIISYEEVKPSYQPVTIHAETSRRKERDFDENKKKSRLKRMKDFLNFPRKKAQLELEQDHNESMESILGPNFDKNKNSKKKQKKFKRLLELRKKSKKRSKMRNYQDE